ncbi:unnamed protein product [Didymodactylos carnosus]|uniref:Cytidyltransferase-like domain-containing protein n=1 Tax=Didymodactylos carnosus TaxID=1234261 RepID=A0A815HU65_9BILA|nr:unnamed protein product [Didymodactylos carnosus]CAF1356708.1 unnamed protein product [Didymodactylos carnosus]CAF4133757.1 unnamed protein product [Didymodactylos carnosus]CAF4230947.1 unnamed protein product [Didymodactylos carnosus]
MHSKETTNLDLLIANLQPNSNENCVLITTGALNPIHKTHILNLIQTKSYLERSPHNFNVLAGYLSPTHDNYVAEKLFNKHIQAEHRIAMCNEAVKEAKQEHWISVDRAECMATKFIDFPEVCEQLFVFLNDKLVKQQKLLQKAVRVIYVCGLDHFNKCGNIDRLARDELGIAVIHRQNSNEKYINGANADPNIFYVSKMDSKQNVEDVSSSLIRQRLQQGQSCDHLTYQSVLKYLKVNKL